ncbi:hypothetical protein MCHI_003903 [Candidatus Magnetoovum chiemensis]|nr:hypothetical protein MCHI_003903 [Candidatus Magnetoovum chiemensis]
MINEKAQDMRLKYLYRRLIISGKVKIPYKAAARLVGPDCAYHLYSTIGVSKKDK